MVIWIVFTAVDSDVCVDPHRKPHQKVSAASVHKASRPLLGRFWRVQMAFKVPGQSRMPVHSRAFD